MISKDWPFLTGSRYLIIPQDFWGLPEMHDDDACVCFSGRPFSGQTELGRR